MNDLASVHETFDFSCDLDGPAAVVASEQVMKTFALLVGKRVKIRCLTEITESNLLSCKKLMEYCELRHVNGIRGAIGISDLYLFASYSNKELAREPENLRSESKEFVQLQHSFYIALWERAVPASVRIAQIEAGVEPEITEIVTGWEGITNRTIDGFSRAKQRVDHCCDSMIPPRMAESPVHMTIIDFVKRGGKVRMITEITAENLPAIKELMKAQEIRHINGFKLNFGVSDALFSAPTSVYSLSAEPQCIWSNSRGLISQHQYLYDTLWNSAIPADVRIREIEQGIAPEIIEAIRDSSETQKLALKLVENAQTEVLIIFSSTGAFMRLLDAGLTERIEKSVKERNVSIKIITPIDENVKDVMGSLLNYPRAGCRGEISVHTSEVPTQTMLSIIVSDRSYSLAVEFDDMIIGSSQNAIGLATYSNSKNTVLSYVTLFESMWSQIELNSEIRQLYEHLKVQEQEQKEFIDIAAHEFKNPLQPILFLSEILRDHVADNRSQQLLEVIIRNAKRLQLMQEEILDVSRIEHQTLRLDKEQFDLNQLLLEVTREFQEQRVDMKVSFVCECKGDLVILADRRRLTQVVANLLSNAAKFTKSGSIYVRTRKLLDGYAEVTVTDTGEGIDPEILPRLFTKYASKSRVGTGLGLYISKGIINAHGGQILGENNIGSVGAKFSFTIPRSGMD